MEKMGVYPSIVLKKDNFLQMEPTISAHVNMFRLNDQFYLQ